MEDRLANITLTSGRDKNTTSKSTISNTSNLNSSPKTMAKRRVSFSIVTPEHPINDESLQESEAGGEEAGTDNVETGDRFGKSCMERKWSLASSFSFGSKSPTSLAKTTEVWSTRSSRSSLLSDESFGSS